MRFPVAVAVLTFAALAGSARAAQFGYALFKPSTLAAVDTDVQANNSFTLPGRNFILFADLPKVRVTVTYLAAHRPISDAETQLIDASGKSRRLDMAAYAPLFKEAFAFEDAGKRYWLPVEGPVADFFIKELKVGQRIALYGVAIGGIAENRGSASTVLLVEEFDADPATTH